jgi:hypothetical protein
MLARGRGRAVRQIRAHGRFCVLFSAPQTDAGAPTSAVLAGWWCQHQQHAHAIKDKPALPVRCRQ